MSSYTPLKTVLLTGAGFTKTFGGYLGSEMWAALLRQPEIQGDNRLRRRLLDVPGLNFEMFYDEVENLNHFTLAQKALVRVALQRAYNDMDDCIRNGDKAKAAGVQYFLMPFAGADGIRTRGFIFTLNQDLFVERFYTGAKDIRLPGITTRPEWFKASTAEWKYEIQLPTENEVAKFKEDVWRKGQGSLIYIKLHGSNFWKSEDGSEAMVIGYGKRGRTEKEPLLSWYLQIFEEILNQGDVNLVTIGYGFGDDYINALIGEAMKNSRLRLNIICPTEPSTFRNQVVNCPAPDDFSKFEVLGDIIWQGLARYYPATVMDFYTPGTSTLPPQGISFFRALGLL